MCCTLPWLDIGRYWKATKHQGTLERAISLNGYIYNCPRPLNMMRRIIRQKELLRFTKTRFAIAFITLLRLHEQKNNLRKMFTSSDWSNSKWAKEKEKTIANIVLMPSFWNTIVFCLKVLGPLFMCFVWLKVKKKSSYGITLWGHE